MNHYNIFNVVITLYLRFYTSEPMENVAQVSKLDILIPRYLRLCSETLPQKRYAHNQQKT
ncbi:hypothetical protein H5410_021936 [Solanum commersonii]|uniref:Uncharacterized protein n=1 Tax=Solanum commersonii TaxID=4109 RepID=A0A9J5ZFD1_SOLCO|nr:hypothetical protein H5410_021936 [Solanum commersonii]